MIEKNLMNNENRYHSIFETDRLLVLFINTFSPQLLIFFPDGYLAASIKKCKKEETNGLRKIKAFSLFDADKKLISHYIITGQRKVEIAVYNQNSEYIGCFERKQVESRRNAKKELLNDNGRFVGAVEGAAYYMDEQIIDPNNRLTARLRRGWMPLEWGSKFPDPNTPILSFSKKLNEIDKILQFSLLINEYFLER